MTEREKMLAGLIYTSADRELAALNARAKKTVREYNDCAVEDGEKRKALMRSLLGGCGRNFGMEPPVRFDYGCNTYLGENFFANYNLTVLDCAEVRIGNNVMCGPNVTFATPVHPLLPADRNMHTAADGTPYDYEYARPITVEDDVTAYVEYPNGATGVFISTTGEFPGTNRFEIVLDRATILCENGKLSVFELEDSQQHFIDTCPEGFGQMDGGFIDIETDGENPQHDGVLRAFAAAILRGEPLIARGEEGINGLTLSNAMFLSSWLNETVTLPLDEELFYAELKRRIDSSKAKKESQDTVVFNVEGTFGS